MGRKLLPIQGGAWWCGAGLLALSFSCSAAPSEQALSPPPAGPSAGPVITAPPAPPSETPQTQPGVVAPPAAPSRDPLEPAHEPAAPDDEEPRAPIDPRTIAATHSWGVCRLVTPSHLPGIGGSDLGFSFLAPIADAATGAASQLVFLFGDTWNQASDACFHPRGPSDDLQATMPAIRPAVLSAGVPDADAASTCSELKIATDDPTSHEPWRPIRLFGSAGERSAETQLDTGFLRAPVTGFSDGKRAFGVFLRNQPVSCGSGADCPSDARCSLDARPFSTPLGECTGTRQQDGSAPTYCLQPSRCSDGSLCGITATGVCLAEPFALPIENGTEIPDWYRSDPRRAILVQVDIASAFWADRPEDYLVGHHFTTNKFVNSVARTVAHFDPDDPDANDYRTGDHTLLMWGRPAFWTAGGAQAPLFLLYHPLDGLVDEQGAIHWQPRFFAGYDAASGKPRWSSLESDALPVYGLADGLEFDLVSHAAITWIEPLARWAMFYGGSVPDWIRTDQATGELPAIVHPQPVPGAIHMRTAAHPWGRATRDDALAQAWTAPTPVLVREELAELLTCERPGTDPSAGCTVPREPSELVSEVIDWATQITPNDWRATASACLAGNLAYATIYSLAGSDTPHLYGANIIDAWTDDVTASLPDLAPDERAVELYWNVSTWNPYQVVLLKTQLRARPF